VSAGLLATLALTAIVVSHVGLGQTELAQAAAAKKTALPVLTSPMLRLSCPTLIAVLPVYPRTWFRVPLLKTLFALEQAVPGLSTQPVDKAETKKLFSYLSAESYTPKVTNVGVRRRRDGARGKRSSRRTTRSQPEHIRMFLVTFVIFTQISGRQIFPGEIIYAPGYEIRARAAAEGLRRRSGARRHSRTSGGACHPQFRIFLSSDTSNCFVSGPRVLRRTIFRCLPSVCKRAENAAKHRKH